MRRYHVDGSPPNAGEVFVFGSNLSGLHVGGAARAAHDLYGALWGVAEGRERMSYAIPTVQKNIAGPLPLQDIKMAVERFLRYAYFKKERWFFVTRVGCVLAGHRDADIAPMFSAAPPNCSLPDPWQQFLEKKS